jgi:hypothetical protein
VAYPGYRSQTSCNVRINESGIQTLVIVNAQTKAGCILKLGDAVVVRERVVIHQKEIAATGFKKLFNIRVRPDVAFFLRNDAPGTGIRASARGKTHRVYDSPGGGSIPSK